VTLWVATSSGVRVGMGMMNAGKNRPLWCATLLALTCTTCGSEQRQPEELPPPPEVAEEVHGEPCVYDADCASSFCDSGYCAEVGAKGHHGWECDKENVPPIRQVDRCGRYLCIDHRCRSCQSDAQCEKYWKGPTCAKRGDWPGKGCGMNFDPGPPAAPPPPPPSELPPE
jgi:hypothetical protein